MKLAHFPLRLRDESPIPKGFLPKKKAGRAKFRVNPHGAKIRRPQLFELDEARRHIVVHNLRATFVTVSLAGGKSEAWITDEAR